MLNEPSAIEYWDFALEVSELASEIHDCMELKRNRDPDIELVGNSELENALLELEFLFTREVQLPVEFFKKWLGNDNELPF